MTYRRTAYEITATKGDQVYLIAYTPQVSRAGLLKAMRKRGEAIISRLNVGNDDQITFATKPRIHASLCGWTIGFTGRTMLESKRNEHPYIAD